jgi:hypothetical protein
MAPQAQPLRNGDLDSVLWLNRCQQCRVARRNVRTGEEAQCGTAAASRPHTKLQSRARIQSGICATIVVNYRPDVILTGNAPPLVSVAALAATLPFNKGGGRHI